MAARPFIDSVIQFLHVPFSFEMQNHQWVNAHGTPRREITGGQCRYREYNGCE
jgi:hypothetical protein